MIVFGDDPDRQVAVRAVRLGAAMVGSLALLAAMLFLSDGSRARNWAWSAGVALLVLSWIANRLLPGSRQIRR